MGPVDSTSARASAAVSDPMARCKLTTENGKQAVGA